MSAPSPGALRHRVTLQQPADVDDGAGGVTRGFTPLADVFAAVAPLSAEEAREGAALGLRRLWRVTLRVRGDLTGGHRAVWAGRALDVLSVRALDAENRFEELLCEEFSA